MTRVLIADDNDDFREMLHSYLELHGGFAVEAVVDLPQALAAIRAGGPYDMVLLDLSMPGMNGLTGLKEAADANGGRPVALMSGLVPDHLLDQLVAAGGAGFLSKAQLAGSAIPAIRAMIAGDTHFPSGTISSSTAGGTNGEPASESEIRLSPRERQVLTAICAGYGNRDIADQLNLREPTIKLHVKMICSKLRARNRTHAAMIAREEGLC
ncbi:MAG: response regulator transcription factor [Sphingomonadales bacterium]|jgi:DNA-binding NarL/FixJ family response regulator